MKTIILVIALLLFSATAYAGTTCNRVGQFTYCNDGMGNSMTCNQVGQFTYCN